MGLHLAGKCRPNRFKDVRESVLDFKERTPEGTGTIIDQREQTADTWAR